MRVLGRQQSVDQCHLLGAGEQGRGFSPVRGGGGVGLEQSRGEGVEGRNRDGGDRGPQPAFDPAPEVGHAPPREAEQQELLGSHSTLFQQPRDPADEELGLAGSGSTHHQLRPVPVGQRALPVGGIDLNLTGHEMSVEAMLVGPRPTRQPAAGDRSGRQHGSAVTARQLV